MNFVLFKVGNDQKIRVNQVPIGQPFILADVENDRNPQVYMRLETHGSAWEFLRLSDMSQQTCWSLRWAHNDLPYVEFVEITNLEVRFKVLEVTRQLYSPVLSLERQYYDKLEVLLFEALSKLTSLGEFLSHISDEESAQLTMSKDLLEWWHVNRDRKLWVRST